MSLEANSPRPKLAVIDYGMGNLRSVLKAWEYVGAETYLIRAPAAIGNAAALVLAGQGAGLLKM